MLRLSIKQYLDGFHIWLNEFVYVCICVETLLYPGAWEYQTF